MEAARTTVPTPGTLVNSRYRVGGSIGEGGMGVVLAARDEREGRDVAIKLLQVVGEQNIERFLREAKLSMKIDSQHVVKVLDVGQLNGCPFFVMERLDGEDFGQKVREGELSLTEVADCILQTCEALAHAHGKGIVHRDIKASNVFEHRLPNGDTVVKVLDFGISKHFATNPAEVERTLTRTRDGGFLGSPPYMSPEHVKDPRNVDGRSDLWSLGVVAYRLLSTQFPFPGESTGEVLAAILEGKPKRLRQLHVEVPEAVDELIIERMLARDREARCPDAGAVARAFAPYASLKWRGYGESVPDIVARGVVPSPTERSSKRKVVEPRTATVAPPVVEDEPQTLALDDVQAQAFMPPAVSSNTGPFPIAIAVEPVTPVPSPLDVLSSGPLPFLREVEQKPKSRVGLLIGFMVCVLVGAGAGTGYVITHRKAPPLPAFTAPAPPPPVAATESAPPAPTPIPTPATSTVELATPAPAESHPSRPSKKPGRGPVVRPPAPAPAPAPPPPAASKPKDELEKNPYGKTPPP